MKAFLIDTENNVIAYGSVAEAHSALTEGGIAFSSQADFTHDTAPWPASRLVEIWNTLPGVVAVKKFTNRKTAIQRIWTAIQKLEPPTPVTANTVSTPPSTRAGTKKAAVLSLLQRSQGATVPEIMTKIGWQSHSVRGFLSTLKKRGAAVSSIQRPEGERAYILDPGAVTNIKGEVQ